MIEKDCEQEVCGLREKIMSRSRHFRDGFQNGLKFWFGNTIFFVFLFEIGSNESNTDPVFFPDTVTGLRSRNS